MPVEAFDRQLHEIGAIVKEAAEEKGLRGSLKLLQSR
jgi:hypothetical protein